MLFNKPFSNNFYPALAFLAGAAIPLSTALQNITIALICICAIFDPQIRINLKILIKNYFILSCVLFYFALILWSFKSHATTSSIEHMLIKMRIFLLCPFICAYFMLQQNRVFGCFGFAIGAIITIILSIVAFSLKLHFLFAGITETSGPFGSWAIFRYSTYHNYFIVVMVIALITMMLYYKNSLFTAQKLIITTIILISSFDVLYLIQGRAGQILFILMVGLSFILWEIKRGSLLIIALAIISCIAIATSPAIKAGITHATSDINQYGHTVGNAKTSVGARIEFYKYTLKLIKLAPIAGYGTGSFSYEYQKHTPFNSDAVPRHPHNDFYWLWVELGILGPIFLSLITLTAIYYGFKLRTPDGKMAIVIAISYPIGALQGGFFTDNASSSAFMIIMAILLMGSTFEPILRIIRNNGTKGN